MNTVQLAPLNIGSKVFLKTTSKAECTGIYAGYLEEKHSICLNDAKWHGAGTDIARTHYDSLILPLEKIAHIEGIQSETAAFVTATPASKSETSLVKVSDIISTSSISFNGFAEPKFQLKSNIATNNSSRMQEFCKQLFNSCNFAHLLQMQAKENKTKFCIKLPSYYASFFRQPKLYLETAQPSAAAIAASEGNQSLAIFKPDIAAAIDMDLVYNLNNLNVNALEDDGAGDSEPLNLNLCSKLSNLHLNGNYDNKVDADFEAVEVDLSNLQRNHSFAQIKIGNLYFKTSTQIKNLSTQEKMQEN